MKVLYVISSLKNTGVVRVLFNIINKINGQVVEASVVCLKHADGDAIMFSKFESMGVNVYTANQGSKIHLVHTILVYRKLIKELEPNVIHFHGFVADLFFLFIPQKAFSVSTAHNINVEDFKMAYGSFIGEIMSIVQNHLFRKMDKVVSVSESVSNYLNSKGIKTKVIYNGVIPPSDLQVRQRNLAKQFISTGDLIERKNVGQVLRTFAKHWDEPFEIKVLGDGPLRDQYKHEYNTNSIQYVGRVSNVYTYLQNSDVFISASKSEGLPMAVIEAMSTNLPLLLSDIPQHRELRKWETPFIQFFKIDDDEDLYSKIQFFTKMNLSRCDTQRMFDRYFSADVMAAGYAKLYTDLSRLQVNA